MMMDGSCRSSDSFQFEASGSSFGFPAYTSDGVDSFEAFEDLSLFVETQETSQYLSTPWHPESEITTKVPPAPIRETQVKFSTVETRTYAVVVGDSPACTDGLPICLDWSYNPKVRIEPVESEDMVYDSHYPAQRLSYFDRKLRLLEISDIKIDDLLQSKRAVEMSRIESKLEVEELPKLKRPKRLVSQAA
jgi:hypothetical protein